MIAKHLVYLVAFFGALGLTLILTPVVREFNRRMGMVDKPDPRRINKVPIPRGGGLALFLGVAVTTVAIVLVRGVTALGAPKGMFWPLLVLATATVAVGYADDKFGLHPRVKLLGQLLVAFFVWFWADLGFGDLWPALDTGWWRVLDCALTVFWITGAINAFNLIDGLDGLASGLALIATLGMAGALFFSGHGGMTLFYFVFAGGLIGFLRYNYNPASVFLGDSGSMLIGYTLAILPLCSHTPNSFLVSVGVPLLAMGVPIFDTSLAIVRRSIRRLLKRGGAATGNAEVMTADTDHLHHRILRAAGLNQKKAAWTLYALAAFFVSVGLVGILLESRAVGLWIVALAVASVIVVRDMARVELFDAGLLLDRVAHARDTSSRRRWAKLAVPFYLTADILLLLLAFIIASWATKIPFPSPFSRTAVPVRIASTFACLVFFRTYVTVWSRAMVSNYLRLFLATSLGAAAGAVVIYYLPTVPYCKLATMTLIYGLLSFLFLAGVRLVRSIVRDAFYAIDCNRMVGRKDVSRVLVYGTGLRYRAFRRELVRSTSANNRMIVGLLDDDIVLRGHYIGGCRVMGTLNDAPEVINAVNADAVVIAFDVTDEWMKVVSAMLKPTGVKVTRFAFGETDVEMN